MKMFGRLRYLLAEGFEVAALSGDDDGSGQGNARIVYLVRNKKGAARLRSEIFDVDHDEMERCSRLFLSTLSGQ
jgi:hypothetical protein